MTRSERLEKLCEEFYLDPTSKRSTGDEDAGFYFLPEDDEESKPIRPWVAVTTMGGEGAHFYVYADFDTFGEAQRGAVENCGDGIFDEYPVAIVNLDTGERRLPRWGSLQWRKVAVETEA